MPCPRSLRGAEPSEGAQSVRLPVLRVHLALRRCSQRPSIDRMALDFRQFSFRHVTRVSPSNSFSVFSLFSALSAGSCPLALSGSGKPLTQGSPLNPSHLRWGCCMHYCGAPDAGGSRLHTLVRPSPRVMGACSRRAPHAYWITSSASSSSDGGIVIPSALAVLRLITNSNLVTCSTGRSAGLAPLRILST
jgi:hypothetical protein